MKTDDDFLLNCNSMSRSYHKNFYWNMKKLLGFLKRFYYNEPFCGNHSLFLIFKIGLQKIIEENRNLKEQKLCKICLDEDVGVLFEPCGHICCCASCAVSLQQCPICRQPISKSVKAYISWAHQLKTEFVSIYWKKMLYMLCNCHPFKFDWALPENRHLVKNLIRPIKI